MESHVRTLCTALTRRFEVTALVCNSRFAGEEAELDGVRVVRLASLGRFRSMPVAPGFPGALSRLARDAALIHTHHPFPLGEVSVLLARPRVPVVVTWHSDIVAQRLLLKGYAPLLRRFLARVDLILVTSPQYRDSSPWLAPHLDKCRVAPLGIDVAPLAATPETDARAQSVRREIGSPLVLFVGRFIYYKGCDVLLEAFSQVVPDTAEARLLMVGEGPLEAELRRRAERLGIADRVVFRPTASEADLTAYYHACDFLVLPSVARSEAFGLVQLEAMACGKPVISTDLPTGVPFVNADGRTGLVVPPCDPTALARAMTALITDPAAARHMGTAARERVHAEFTQDVMVWRVADVYRELGVQ